MHWGERLKAAATGMGITAKQLAEVLSIDAESVRTQWRRSKADDGTQVRYARGMTQILVSRRLPVMFTAESLKAGPDPVMPEVPGASPLPPLTVPLPPDAVDQLLAEAQRRNLPLGRIGQAAQPPPELDAVGDESVRVRFYGDVPCGTPINLGDRPVAIKQWDRARLEDIRGWREERCYTLRAKGASMVGFDINDGDYLVVDRDAEPRDLERVIVQINGDTVCRRVKRRADGGVELQPGNPSYESIYLRDGDELHSLGVVIGTLPAPRSFR